jgi:hypothetical protein
VSSIVGMLACARPQDARRPTQQSTCLYYFHGNEASKCGASSYVHSSRLALTVRSEWRGPQRGHRVGVLAVPTRTSPSTSLQHPPHFSTHFPIISLARGGGGAMPGRRPHTRRCTNAWPASDTNNGNVESDRVGDSNGDSDTSKDSKIDSDDDSIGRGRLGSKNGNVEADRVLHERSESDCWPCCSLVPATAANVPQSFPLGLAGPSHHPSPGRRPIQLMESLLVSESTSESSGTDSGSPLATRVAKGAGGTADRRA